MSAEAAEGTAAHPPAGADWPLVWFVSGLGVVLIALVVISDGNIGVIAVPLLVVGVVALMWRVPLRYPIFVFLFLGITMEAPYESFAGYLYRTPIYLVGTALLGNLNLVTGIKALSFSGADLLILYLFIILAWRRATNSTIDGPLVPAAPPMIWAATFSLASGMFIWLHGLATGGDFSNSLWQVQKILYIPLFFLLFQSCLRGPKDLGALAKVFVVGGVYRALIGAYIHYNVTLPDGAVVAFCTTHADTILFVDVLTMMILLWNERVLPKRRWLYGGVMLIILIGLVFNNRRIAWVTLSGALVMVATVSPWTALKRRIARSLLILAPLLVVYLAVGWNAGGGLFKPAQLIRGVIDSKHDTSGSSEWRDTENKNLTVNIEEHPILGVGYGHEYIEFIKLAEISDSYPQFRYIPHNSVLATWAFAGVLGFTGLWTMLVMLVFLAARSYHRSAVPAERAAAMMCIVAVIAYINEVYGDIGVSYWLGPLTLAPAMVVASKLATKTGAWPSRSRPTPSMPPPEAEDDPHATVVPIEPVPLTLPGAGSQS